MYYGLLNNESNNKKRRICKNCFSVRIRQTISMVFTSILFVINNANDDDDAPVVISIDFEQQTLTLKLRSREICCSY